MVGIATGLNAAGWSRCAAVLALLSAAVMARQLLRQQQARFSPLLLMAAVGYLSIQPWSGLKLPPQHIRHFIQDQAWQISATVMTDPRATAAKTSLVLGAIDLHRNGAGGAVAGRLKLTLYGRGQGLAKGQRLRLRAKLRAVRNFNNPGGFDYRRYLALQDVWATTYAQADAVTLLDTPSSAPLWALTPARDFLSTLMAEAVSETALPVLQALVLGDRRLIAPQQRQAFNRAGVGHVLAISGLHIGIVAAFAFGMGHWLLKWIPWLLRHAWSHKLAALLALGPVVAYGLLAGMSPSTQRAIIAVAIILLALCLQRRPDPFNTLAAAAMAILAWHPPSLAAISFQLSFAAVGLILLGHATLRPTPGPLPAGWWARIYRWIRGLVRVSIWATLGTLPLTMLYFSQFSLVGPLANCVVVPVVAMVVVPAGLLSATLAAISPALGMWGFKFCGLVLDPTLYLIDAIAAWPLSAITTIIPSGIEIGLYYTLLVCLALLLLYRRRPAAASTRPWRRRHAVALVCGLVMVLWVADIAYWSYQRFGRKDLRITVIDVGQGNAALLELPGGHCMLVDGGGFSGPTAFDVGARIIAPLLGRKKIRTVETLVLSHPEADHLNGLIHIARHFNVQTLWSNGQAGPSLGYQALLNTVKTQKIAMPPYANLPRMQSIAGVRFTLMGPPVDFQRLALRQKWRHTNNNSLVLKVSFGAFAMLLPGDIHRRVEQELVAAEGSALQSTVLLAPHHGSRTSSASAFLAKVNPRIVIVSAGWGRRRYFPHAQSRQRYQQLACKLYCTHTDGAVQIVTDGRRLRVQTVVGSGPPLDLEVASAISQTPPSPAA
jgi:competence protein ComEC